MSIITLLVLALVSTAAAGSPATPATPANETIYSIVDKHCFELTGPKALVDVQLPIA